MTLPPIATAKIPDEAVGAPRLTGDGEPRSPGAVLGCAALADPEDDAQHRRELDEPQGECAQEELVRRHGDRPDREPGNVAQRLEQADERRGETDLGRRHEIGHVSLERTLRRVRAELEQDEERRDAQDRVRGRDPEQEDEVEDRTDEDVRLAPVQRLTV